MKYFRTWIGGNMIFNKLCDDVGDKVCKRVRYEDLVSRPKETLMDVVTFLNLTWTDEFLKYNEYIGDKVVVSKVEWSSDQIKKPIHTNSIRNWVGNIPDFNLAAFRRESDFLVKFGYNDTSVF
jgi:protein-tyrosine sulfotransferase